MKKLLSKPDLSREKKLEAFDRLLTIMDELRENCPWDKNQTMESIRHLTIEETYELSDAILEGDLEEVKRELGDLMLSIVFYSRIASETDDFDVSDVIHSVCDKLVERHPHVYGDERAETEEEAMAYWVKAKMKKGGGKSALSGVPRSLPALIKAMRVQEKTGGVGLIRDDEVRIWDDLQGALTTLRKEENKQKKSSELGSLLFSLINYARLSGLNPEEALDRTNLDFVRRFQYVESELKKEGKDLSAMSAEEMDVYWERAEAMY